MTDLPHSIDLNRNQRFALPVVLTFRDYIKADYTTSLYVRKETPRADIEALISAVSALSICTLVKYRIGDETHKVPDAPAPDPASMGSMKWNVSFRAKHPMRDEIVFSRHFAIPGRDARLNAPHRKAADMSNPLWIAFIAQSERLCVSSEGFEIIPRTIKITHRNENWPPKAAKKKRMKKEKKQKPNA